MFTRTRHVLTPTVWSRTALVCLTFAFAMVDATASSSGMVNNTLKNGARTGCGALCHGGTFTALGVSLAVGSTSIPFNGSTSITISISGATASTNYGVNVAASNGSFSEGVTNLQIISGEITHTSPPNNTGVGGSTGSYPAFTYFPPAGSTIGQTYTIYGAARAGLRWGDASNRTITIVGATQAALTARIGFSGTPPASNVGLTGALDTVGGSGSGAVSYASLTGTVCTVASVTVSYITSGTCTVRATKAGDTQYNSAIDDVSVVVNQGTQATLNAFATPGTVPYLTTSTLSTTGGSGTGAVTYSSNNGSCTIVGSTLTGAALGSCTVTATKAADANYLQRTATVGVTVTQAPQVINFAALPNKFTTDPAFTVSASGGGSGNAVTFGATGVCSVGGTLVTLSGAAGSCSITANQMGNTNYAAAGSVTQSFTVNVATSEVFPPACQMPTGWYTPAGATTGWSVATDSVSAGACSLKSNVMPDTGTPLRADLEMIGYFVNGNVTFTRRVSSENQWDCFQFFIDGVAQIVGGTCNNVGLTGGSGEIAFGPVSIPITAGSHTLTWRYDKDDVCCTGGSLDAVWIDEVVLPLLDPPIITSATMVAGTVGQYISYQITATNSPTAFGLSLFLPPGLSLNTSSGLVDGTPTTAGTYAALITASNGAGQDTKTITFTIDKGSQVINFPVLYNRFNNAPPFAATATGGNSGNSVTFAATGVCSSSGTNGQTITLSGALGTCTVTASQLGTANYYDAAPVARSFNVVSQAAEIFPANCALPAGWTVPAAATTGWSVVANESSTEGGCSLKSNPLPDSVSPGPTLAARMEFTGVFAAGNITFTRRVSSEVSYDCFRFFIDGVQQDVGSFCPNLGTYIGGTTIGASGEVPFGPVSIPITAGLHTVTWSYDKDPSCCRSGEDAVWIDEVVLPLNTLTVTRVGTGTGTVTSNPAGINCGSTCSAVMSGTVVLTATPAGGSYLSAWSGGGCTGTGGCTVTLDTSKSVQATFDAITGPGAPTSVVATPGNTQASITFVAPAFNGGSPITGYTATCGAATNNGGTSPIVVSGLTNGVTVNCTVLASNAAGPGTPSAPAASVTPRTVPDVPTGLVAAPGNAQATLTFAAPVNTGGNAISAYTATCTASGQTTRTGTAGTSPVTVSLLVNAVEYSCAVVATNAAGNSVPSTAALVTPRSIPGVPTTFTAAPRDGRATFNFGPPVSDGGSAITGYTVSCNGGAVTGSSANPPITISGLTNGTGYTCTVLATNAAGNGTPTSSLVVTPIVNTGTTLWTQVCTACHTTPPSGTQLNGAGSTATVLSYVIANQPTMAGTATVTSLTTAERTALATYIAAQLSTAPQVTAFNTPKPIDLSTQIVIGGVTISFQSLEVVTAPLQGTLSAFTGTSITYTPAAGYTGSDSFTYRGKRTTPSVLNGDPRTVNLTISPPPLPVITSLASITGTNGVAFNYQIVAAGATGFGASGLPTNLTVNPMTGLISGIPNVGGPFNATMTASNANPASPVSAPLTITLNPAAQTLTFPTQTPATRLYSPSPSNTFAILPLATSTSALIATYVTKTPAVCSVAGTTVTMLNAGTCTIGANQAGNVHFSVAAEVTQSVAITPVVPGAPIIGVATPGNLQASIAFTQPTNTGGTTITSYAATCTPSGSASNPVSPVVVTGLTNFTLYTCSVRATNSAGQGPASGNVTVTPVPTPTPPVITSAVATTFTVNAPGSFQVTATGTPATFTYSVTGTLPAGVTFSPTTGVLSGTPTQAGPFPLTFGVANGNVPNASQSFSLTVTKANQTIAFSNPGTRSFSAVPIALSAVATSTLAVTFASDTTGVCTVSGANVTLISIGTCTLRAQQTGNASFNVAPDVLQSFSVVQGGQTITFPAQASPLPFVAASTFPLSLATASSGLPVTHTSLTLSVCTIAAPTITMVRAGTCTIAANQAGNANVSAAAQVTQSIVFTGSAPGAPAIGTATGGPSKITVTFTPPGNDGGASITGYSVTCGAAPPQGGSGSPITVMGLTNGTPYSCSVTATNAIGTSGPSITATATPNVLPGAALWTTKCSGCHSPTPFGTRLNVGGNTATALDYVIFTNVPPAMVLGIGNLNSMTPTERAQLAQYVQDIIPPVAASTPINTAVVVDVSSQISLGTTIIAYTTLEIITPPASGAIGAIVGSTITYTPNPGFVGTDTFTYRGKKTALSGDARTVTVTVQPAAPVITSALAVSGTINQPFAYQIAATNAPTSYATSTLPAGLNFNASTGVIGGAPSGSGISNITISATAAGVTGNATLVLTVNLIPQTISFPAQTPASRPYSLNGVVTITPAASGGTSGNPIVYSSTTPTVCTVSGNTFTMLTAGICTLAANQAGNATHSAAAAVTQSVAITGIAPAAPTGVTATAGNTQASISFTAPTNTGGLPITGYTATCNGIAASGAGSPIVVGGLVNGVSYSCTAQATNLAGTSVASAPVNVTPVAIAYNGDNVYSRKIHPVIGARDLKLNGAETINGAITVEPRAIGAGHQIVFRFNNPPTSVTSLSVVDATPAPVVGASASASFSGNDLIITLTGIPDNKRVTVTATGVNNALTVFASMGFLVGDVTGSKSVNAADISAVKARVGATVGSGNNYLFDLDANNVINNADVSAVKARAGRVMP